MEYETLEYETMEYKTFLERIRQEIQHQIGSGGVVQLNRTIKNNSTQKDSISILFTGENVSPAIYLDYFYERYRETVPVEQIAEQILVCYCHSKKTGRTDFSFYLDFEKVKEHIFCKIVNYEKNMPVLDLIPHERFLDLAIVYYCEVESDSFGTGTVLVQNTHLLLWGIDQKRLHETAVYNTLHDARYDLVEISELVEDMTGVAVDSRLARVLPMYVLTNNKKYFGAVNLYFNEVLEEIAEQLEADYYVLPSSIHECMVVPAEDSVKLHGADYQEMVQEINDEFVAPEEILSDSVYRYYRDRKELCIVACGRPDSVEE